MQSIQKNSIYLYQQQRCEVLDIRSTFGREVISIRMLKTGEIKTVNAQDLAVLEHAPSVASIRFLAFAAKINNEVLQQGLLAPFESSIVPLPHQILALEKVMKGQHLRFLMADEVGMGKTIETGLVLKELKLRGIVKKSLVIVPKSAMYQWKQEMKKHFNEDFHIYDTELINTLSKTFALMDADADVNIWNQHQQVIISTDALRPITTRSGWSREKVAQYNRFRIERVIEADFDLLVIDECHKVGGSTQSVSRFQMAEMLCTAIPNVLLLSATPHRGKSDHFRRILQLLDSDAFTGEGAPSLDELEPYVVRTEKRQAIDYNGKALFNKRTTEKVLVPYDNLRHQKQIDLYEAVTNYVRDGFNLSLSNKDNSFGFVMLLFQRLLSSSTQALIDAMEKRLAKLDAVASIDAEEYVDFLKNGQQEEDTDLDEEFMLSIIENTKQLSQEEAGSLEKLVRQAKACQDSERDAKAEYLLKLLVDLKRKEGVETKFLIFTEFTGTQKMLSNILTNIGGYTCVSINGAMDFEQRVTALKRFKDDAQIMVSTDAAGESLNMQFSHIVINYDMPWNPMIIEQRIGRVDRIGQPKEVLALNLMLDNSIDKRVYEVIETKLEQILTDLGIDKSADVLDSTFEISKINKLYLSSLLDPERFEQESTTWLSDIKDKLKEYRSTEGVLPTLDEKEITIEKTNNYKNSPLAVWLKNMTLNYLATKHIAVQLLQDGIQFKYPKREEQIYTFDVKETLINPIPEPLTLQHDIIQDIRLEALPFHQEQGITCVHIEGQNTAGLWSLWKIEAQNGFEIHCQIVPIFIANEGDVFLPYAKKIWDLLTDEKAIIQCSEMRIGDKCAELYNLSAVKAEAVLSNIYLGLEDKLLQRINSVMQNREKSYLFQQKQLHRIGIENIKKSRLERLDNSFLEWKNNFEKEKTVHPSLTCLQILVIE